MKHRTDPTGLLVKRFNVDPRYSNHIPLGWTAIVFDALEQLTESCTGIKILQIKEKLGGLRIYYSVPQGYSEKANDIITKATKECAEHCQLCGCSGQVQYRNLQSWILNACNVCYAIEQNKQDNRYFCYDNPELFEKWKEEQK